jgi:hypothetical protein
MATLIENGYEIISGISGKALNDGYIFIGEYGLSPLTNPQQAYWDEDLTIPANNVRTREGYPLNGTELGRLYTDGSYSILVQDKNGEEVYSNLEAEHYQVLTTADYPSDSAWATVTSLLNGWTGTVYYIKRAGMVTVELSQLVGTSASAVTVLILPIGYRPIVNAWGIGSRAGVTIDSTAVCQVSTSGEILVYATTSATDVRSSLSFPVL